MKAVLFLLVGLVSACGGAARGDSHSVYCIAPTAKAEYTQALIDATEEWNTLAGTSLSVVVGECPTDKPGSTYAVSAGGASHGAAATTYYMRGSVNNEMRYSESRTPNEVRTDFLHEIGHSLGMGHLSDRTAIMFTNTNDVQHLTESDVQAYWNISPIK